MHYPDFSETPLDIPFGTGRKARAALFKADEEYKKKQTNYLLIFWSLMMLMFTSGIIPQIGTKLGKTEIFIGITVSLICAFIIILVTIRHQKYQKWRVSEWLRLRKEERA